MTECKKLFSLVGRNTKCYFKNKFTFFMSLITPLILFVLYITFLRNVYIDSFKSNCPEGLVDESIINGITGAWLMSSILSVSSVTVAFCSNIIMVEDKMNGSVNDLNVSPVKGTTVSIAYFISNFFVTFIVLISIMLVGHIYLAIVGWYIPVGDAFMIVMDIICGILFGTLLAGVVESFIKNQGGLSAVSTLVSSMYGFITGAYMPLSQFSAGLRNVLCLLPGTYGVGIMRNHYMNGYLAAMEKAFEESGMEADLIDGIINGKDGIKASFDGNLYLFGTQIPLWAMYLILLGACALLFAAYVAIVVIKNKKK